MRGEGRRGRGWFGTGEGRGGSGIDLRRLVVRARARSAEDGSSSTMSRKTSGGRVSKRRGIVAASNVVLFAGFVGDLVGFVG